MSDLVKNADIQSIATKGNDIYQRIKTQYEPQKNGKYLAIDTDTNEVFLGEDGSKAVELAKTAHPDKVFYVVKIGFETAETVAHSLRFI